MSVEKLADAFEAQFFQNVKALEENKDTNQSKRMLDGMMSDSTVSFIPDESKFFENMTIHKQYLEYS